MIHLRQITALDRRKTMRTIGGSVGRAAGLPSPPPFPSSPGFQWQLRRYLVKVRLKWVKNRGLDHIIDRDTDIKAAVLLKDAILRSPSGIVPARALSPLQKTLDLTVPVLRFLRRYPTLFTESPHPRFPSLPAFSLAPAASLLHSRELAIHSSPSSSSSADRLSRLLMMSKSRSLPLSSLLPLRYDLGLPEDFPISICRSLPDRFRIHRRTTNGAPVVSLVSSPDDLAVSALQLRHHQSLSNPDYRDFKKPPTSSNAPLAFPMRFPRGYGSMKKVKAWMDDFHRLPYISPYEDASGVDPESEIMEKRVVGVLHELLSLTIHKKTRRNYLRSLREELGLPHKFTRVFTRYPGIFYLSLKCKTTTVMLREGYERGKLVDPHPLALLRDKFQYVMRTGVLYRGKGMTKLVLDEGDLVGGDGVVDDNQMGDTAVTDDDGDGVYDGDEDECYELETSDGEMDSDEE